MTIDVVRGRASEIEHDYQAGDSRNRDSSRAFCRQPPKIKTKNRKGRKSRAANGVNPGTTTPDRHFQNVFMRKCQKKYHKAFAGVCLAAAAASKFSAANKQDASGKRQRKNSSRNELEELCS